MTVRIPAHVREQQINNLQNITFVRWDGEYSGKNTKAVCRCTVDGFEWFASAHSLVNTGRGCPQCARQRRWTAQERVDQINNIPNVKFVRWLNGGYRGARSNIVCTCCNGHEWTASVNNVVNHGSGCPKCAKYGYNPSKPGTLYALRSECGTMVKIGISNNTRQRHTILKRKTPFAFECVELCHGDGAMVATLEKVLHGLMEPIVFDTPFDGSTEWRKWDARLPEWFDLYRHWS